MSAPKLQPTPYSEVNAAVHHLFASLQAVLCEQLVGLYLGGSLALGDFNPHRSDIDFVAVTVDHLAPDLLVALEQVHTRLWATGPAWVRKLDGSYVPQPVVRHWTPEHPPCPFVEGDSFTVTQQGSAVIQRHILHRCGVVVAGPSPQLLVDPVEADELQRALREMLATRWRPLLDDPGWVQHPQQQPFAILSLCRALYTLEHGVVVSKPVAARWCQRTLGMPWTALIAWALDWPQVPESNQLLATQSLVRYTLDRYQVR